MAGELVVVSVGAGILVRAVPAVTYVVVTAGALGTTAIKTLPGGGTARHPTGSPGAPQQWDTAKIKKWMNGLKTKRASTGSSVDAQYQRRTCGNTEYELTAGSGEKIWADSIEVRGNEVVIKDSKAVRDPGAGKSPYEGNGPDFLRKDLDDELVRYKAVIDDPATPATKVEFITNTPEAQRYLTKYIRDKMGPDFPFEVKYVP